MKVKFQLTDWSIIAALASSTMYMVFRNLGRELGSFAYLWAPMALLMIFFNRPRTYITGPIKLLILYGIIIVGILQYTLWKYMGDWNRVRILLEFYYLFVMLAIITYYLLKGEYLKIAIISKWIFIIILITLITTNIALFIDPILVRESAATGEFSSSQNRLYNLSGAMSYSYVQAVICLIPLLVVKIKNRQKFIFQPRVLVLILILILITQIRSQVFANIIVSIFLTILSFAGTRNIRLRLMIISVVSIFVVLIPSSFYSDRIFEISTYFPTNSLLNKKIKGFALFIESPEFDNSTPIAGRAARYPLLFKALSAKPLTGDSSYESKLNIGGGSHLYLMNRLTLWGIPAFLFFIYVLYKVFKKIGSLFDEEFAFIYLLSILSIILLGLLKAVGGREPWLMVLVLIPGLYYLPLLDDSATNKRELNSEY
jgi:hypothetical protein